MNNKRGKKALSIFLTLTLLFSNNVFSNSALYAFAEDNSTSTESSDLAGDSKASVDESQDVVAEDDPQSPEDTSEPEDVDDTETPDESTDSSTAEDESESADLAEDEIALQDDSVIVNSTTTATLNVDWIDNGNSDGKRPATTDVSNFKIYYQISSFETWVELTDAYAKLIGLDAIPSINCTSSGTNRYIYTAEDLPDSITRSGTDITFMWKIVQTIDESTNFSTFGDAKYLSVVNSDSSVTNTLLFDFTVNVKNLCGMESSDYNKSGFVVLKQSGGSWDEANPVLTIDESANSSYLTQTSVDNIYTLTVQNVPKYNSDNTEITYGVRSTNQVVDSSTTLTPQDEDIFAPSYENSQSANHGTETDIAYEGGTISLTRTNATTMTIHKAWLDDNNSQDTRPRYTEDSTSREDQLFLWRYTNKDGNNYTNAAQVLDGNGYPVNAALPNDGTNYKTTGDVVFSYRYTDAANDTSYLPKYDAEGYEYTYLAREEMTSAASQFYEQVYGSVDEAGKVSDTYPNGAARPSADTGIYNDGTISNRLKGMTPVEGTKSWVASAHQSYLSNYRVTMKLQKSTDGTNFEDATDSNGDAITEVLDGFKAETTSLDFARSMPTYDSQGRELKYRWVESKIEETSDGGTTWSECKIYDDSTFITSHNVDESSNNSTLNRENKDWYTTTTTGNEDGTLSVVNKLVGKIDYKVIKKWFSTETDSAGAQVMAEPANGTTLTINLYRNGSVFKTISMTSANKTAIEGQWEYTFNDLDKYDENGNLYDYYAMEVIPSGYHPSYSFDSGTRTLTIENHPGVGGEEISVAKEWIDDSNTAYRPVVTIEVTGTYEKETTKDGVTHAVGDAFSATATLSTLNNWWELVDVTGVAADSIKVIETKLTYNGTDYDVDYSTDSTKVTGSVKTNENGGYEYVVTNGSRSAELVDGYWKYTVSNRRVGEVYYSVTKTWVDGNEEQGARPTTATFVLSSDEGHTISKDDGGNYYVQFTGDDEKFYIYTDEAKTTHLTDDGLKVATTSGTKYSFYGFPKFDKSGKIVHYSITETIPAEDKGDYAISTSKADYVLGGSWNSGDHQDIAVTNQLSSTKTVDIYKTWNDVYQYSLGNRPDLKLTVWYTDHDASGNVTYNLYGGDGFMNYNWTPRTSADGATGLGQAYELKAVFGNLPKYDSQGYEIYYYFEESYPSSYQTNFDYLDATYLDGDSQAVQAGDANKWVVENGSHTLLRNGGTFVNAIANSVEVTGTKIWQNIPTGFPVSSLPSITVSINQKVNGSNGDAKTVATIGSDKFIKNGTNWTFEVSSDGDGNPLPKYNDKGELYEYTVSEEIDKSSLSEGETWESIYSSSESGWTMANIYNTSDSNSANLKITKEWAGRDTSTEKVYPVLRFKIHQIYQGDNSEQVFTLKGTTDGTATTELTYEGLPVYAPDHTLYKYYVTEDAIDGETTTTNFTEGSSADNAITLTAGQTKELTISGAAFTNTYTPETVALTVQKIWNDGDNAANIRPDSIQVSIYRSASSQPGANNAIAEESLGDVEFTLNEAGNWTLSTGQTLAKWAPNGMPWKYRVSEDTTIDGYVVSFENNPAIANSDDMTVKITNSLTKSAEFTKDWQDSNNEFGFRPAYLKLKLQVAKVASESADIPSGDASWIDANSKNADELDESLSKYLCKTFSGSESNCEKYISAADSWKTSISNLPLKAKIGGTEYYLYYRIIEVLQDGKYAVSSTTGQNGADQTLKNYDVTIHDTQKNGDTFATTTTNKIKTTSLKINKDWSDSNNYFNKRESVTFKLQYRAKGSSDAWTDTSITKTLTAANNWTVTVSDVPECDASGNELEWQAVETTTLSKYEAGSPRNDTQVSEPKFITATTNTLKVSTFKIEKKGTTSESLGDITFDCYNGNTKIFTWNNAGGTPTISGDAVDAGAVSLTNSGEIKGLPQGTYTFKEVRSASSNPAYNQDMEFSITVSDAGTLMAATLASGSSGSVALSNDAVTVMATDDLAKASLAITKVLTYDESDVENLANVTFQLYKLDGSNYSKVDGATEATDSSGKATFSDLEVGKYFIVETVVPDNVKYAPEIGYFFEVTNEDGGKVVADTTTSGVKYTANEDGQDVEVTLTNGNLSVSDNAATISNTPLNVKLKFKKVDSTDESIVLTDATFKLYHKGYQETSYKEVTGEITDTNADGTYERTDLEFGDYQLVEVTAPTGYTISAISGNDADGVALEQNCVATFKVEENENTKTINLGSIKNDRIPGSVTINKTQTGDAATKIEGAEFTLQKINDDGTYSTISDGVKSTDANGSISWSNLEWGDYQYFESAGVDGYIIGNNSTPVQFTIDAKATIHTFDVTNDVCLAKVLKVDENGNALAGASFELYDSSNTMVSSWTSAGDAKSIEKLKVGESYTLKETAAPNGYGALDAEITFSIADSGKVTLESDSNGEATVSDDDITIEISNSPSASVSFVKVSDVDQSLISGATYELYSLGSYDPSGASTVADDESGILVLTTTTGDDGKINLTNIKKNFKYRLHESAAPAGSLRSAEDVTFYVNDSGEIVLIDAGKANGASTATDGANGTIYWNEPQTEIHFLKLNEDGEALSGAALQVEDGAGNVVDSWVTDGELHDIIGKLEAGKTYKLVETSAPDGYEIAQPVEFVVNDAPADPGRMHAQTIIMVDEKTPVNPFVPLAKTGDELSSMLSLILGILCIAVGFGLIQVLKRRKK